MRGTVGKWEMGKLRRNEYCVLLEVEGRFPFFAVRFSVVFLGSLYGFIIIIMPEGGCYWHALVKLSDLEDLLYECLRHTECILQLWFNLII